MEGLQYDSVMLRASQHATRVPPSPDSAEMPGPHRLTTVLLLLLLLPAAAIAQGAGPDTLPTSRAVRAMGAIRLDGRLDDAAWADAPVHDRFWQIDPAEGQPASQRTEVRVVYDDLNLYVGVRLWDTGPVTARLGRRDMSLGDSDWFGVMLDSYHDHRTAFGFDVNPAGVRRDEVKTINQDDNSWDPVWDVATSIDSAGWTAEYRIPFSQLRFSRDNVQTWGVQFERVIGRNNEYAVSTFIPKRAACCVPRYGHLEGLSGLTSAARRLELLPYTVARSEHVDPGPNPYRTTSEQFGSAGIDVLYRLAPNLTLNATINPDFGQVEVDPAVVNLGVYETFFQEKRPFFLEGREIFDFGLGNTSGGQLFYSRRIGRAPTLFPSTAEADRPTQTTILGAAKLSGKLAGWSIGSLAAVTQREESRFRLAGGSDTLMTAEPMSEYFVTRARRELRDGRSIVGGIVTLTHRELDDPFARALLRSDAFAGGMDFRHEFANRTWMLRGDAEVSSIAGSESSIIAVQRASNHYFQRPDATHLAVDSAAQGLSGYSTSLSLVRQGGEHWRGNVAAALTSPGYEVNDLGFAVRTDRRDVAGTVTYQQNTPGELFRRWSTSWQARHESNYAGEPILTFALATLFLQTPGYWTFHAFTRRMFQAYDDRLTRGGPLAIRPGEYSGSVFVATDARKPVVAEAEAGYARSESNAWQQDYSLTLRLKSSTWWSLTVGPQFQRSLSAAQFVTRVTDAAYTPTYGVRYIFAPLRYTEVGLETRFNATFSPDLSLETYVQPLLSSGDYGAPKQLVRPRRFDFEPYAQPAPNLDFNLRSLRGNAVLRWEWREGSTMYVAWQQSRGDVDPIGDFDFGRDRAALFATRPDNIFLVKLNYWLNP